MQEARSQREERFTMENMENMERREEGRRRSRSLGFRNEA
jgi:hypothetical protein